MIRVRILGGIVAACGLALVVTAFSTHLFPAAPAIEELTDDFRASFSDEAIATTRADLTALDDAGAALREDAPAVLGPALGVEPGDVPAALASQYPDVAAGLVAIPDVVTNFSALTDLLEANQDNFMKADAVPTESLPANVVPWQVLLSGIVLLLLGGWLWLRPVVLPALLGVGFTLVLLLATVALSLPDKASATNDLTANTADVFTPAQAESAQMAVSTLGAMAQQLNEELIPDLAAATGTTPEEVATMLASQLPAVGTALAGLDEALERFQMFADGLEANVQNYTKAARPDLAAVVQLEIWLAVVALIASGASAVVIRSARRE